MGRKKTQPDEKYLKRRRSYLKSKGYSDEEIEKMLIETAEDPLFDSVMNDVDLVNNFNKTLLNFNEGKIDTNNSEEIIETNEEFDETNTNDKIFTNTNTNTKTNDNVFVNDNVNDNVKFEFDDNLKNEDSQFTEQQQQASNDQTKDVKEDNKEGGSISGKMFMLTFNVLLTTASKFVKKDLTFDNDEINEFSKLYDEAYPEGLPISPKYVFWGGIIVTISTKALKK